MIWIDSSIPRAVARALALVRDDILYVGDRYPFDANKDTVWLSDAGREDGLVILRDKRIRSRPGERRVLFERSVGAFIINQKANPTRWQYLRLIASSLDDMIDRFAVTPRPFVFTVDSHGQLRQVAVHPPRG